MTIMMKMLYTKRKQSQDLHLRVLVHINHCFLGNTAVLSIFLLLVCSGIQIFFLSVIEKRSYNFRFNQSFDQSMITCSFVCLILFYLVTRTSLSTDFLRLVEIVGAHGGNGSMPRPEFKSRLSQLQANALSLSYPAV